MRVTRISEVFSMSTWHCGHDMQKRTRQLTELPRPLRWGLRSDPSHPAADQALIGIRLLTTSGKLFLDKFSGDKTAE